MSTELSGGPAAEAGLHPCQRCGACCAFFRVRFFWGECAEAGAPPPGPDAVDAPNVPLALVEAITPFRVAMVGTNRAEPRCAALVGEVGERTACGIYAARSSPCRELQASYENGAPDEKCDRARAKWGLAPLGPQDWPPA
jgi:Fe-S-cluster containining protein